MRTRMVVSSGIMLSVLGAVVSAQNAAATRRVGVALAVNSSTIGGKEVTGAKPIIHGAFGGVLVFQRTPKFAIQTELLWTMKGADDSDNAATLHMEYVEVP